MDLYDFYIMVPKRYRKKLFIIGFIFIMLLILLVFVGFYAGCEYCQEICQKKTIEYLKDRICF